MNKDIQKNEDDKLDKYDVWTIAAILCVNAMNIFFGIKLCGYDMNLDVPEVRTLKDDNKDNKDDILIDYDIDKNVVVISKDKQMKTIQTFDDLNTYFNGSLVFHTEVTDIDDYSERTLWIESNGEKPVMEISDAVYEKINSLIVEYQCNHLILYNLGNEIEFSKLEISNIPWLTLDTLQNGFDYAPFSNSIYERLDIKTPFTEPLKEWLKHLDLHQTTLDLIDYNRLYTEYCATETSYLEFLVNENIDLSEATLSIELVDPNVNDFHLLEQINARQINFGYCLFQPSINSNMINLHLQLNPKIEYFHIDFLTLVDSYDLTLGNIIIDSKNETILFGLRASLDCHLSLTEETIIQIPPNTTLALHGCRCTSSNFLDYLTSVNKLIGILHIGDTFVDIAYQKDGDRTLDDIQQEIKNAIGFSYMKK